MFVEDTYTELSKLDGMIKVDIDNYVVNKKKTVKERELELENYNDIMENEHLEKRELKRRLKSCVSDMDFNSHVVDDVINKIIQGKNKKRAFSVLKKELLKTLFSLPPDLEKSKIAQRDEDSMNKTLGERKAIGVNSV